MYIYYHIILYYIIFGRGGSVLYCGVAIVAVLVLVALGSRRDVRSGGTCGTIQWSRAPPSHPRIQISRAQARSQRATSRTNS